MQPFARPRLDALFGKAAGHTLVSVVAPTGYGKTTAVSQYLKGCKEHAWIEIGTAHRDPRAYWAHLVQCLSAALPGLATALQALAFPETAEQMLAFSGLLAQQFEETGPYTLVHDDYALIIGSETEQFISRLVHNPLGKLCFVVISSAKTGLGFHFLKNGGSVFQISGEDLRFTPQEAQGYYRANGVELPGETFDSVYELTQGWPLPLVQFGAYYQRAATQGQTGAQLNFNLAVEVLKSEYYAPYSTPVRRLLVLLAMLDGFYMEMAIDLGEENGGAVHDMVSGNLLLHYNATERTYVFHPLYARYLAEMRMATQPEDAQAAFIRKAGTWLCQHGRALQAALLYGRHRLYAEQVRVIGEFPEIFATSPQADALMDQLEDLPEDFLQTSAHARYILAVISMVRQDTQKAGRLLGELEAQLSQSSLPEDQLLYGEVCVARGEMCKMRNDTGFVHYYKLADHCLPFGSRYQLLHRFYLRDSKIFSAGGPGGFERMEAAYHEAMPYMNRVMHGNFTGCDDIVSAERAYYTFDFAQAKMHAWQALLKTKQEGLPETMGYARYLLARTAMFTGKLEDFNEQLEAINRDISEKPNAPLFQYKDSIEGWMYFALREYGKIPAWIMDHEQVRSGGYWGPPVLLHANTLLATGQLQKVLAMADYAEHYSSQNGFFIWRAYTAILRALAHIENHAPEAALDAFYKAYRLTVEERVLTPFVEYASAMRRLVDLARKPGKYDFDPAWLDTVYTKCSSHAKRLARMAEAYARQHHLQPAAPPPLTKTELAILEEISLGLTRGEMADTHQLSENTVNTHIRNIFSKLGARNSAEAVRIAFTRGLLEV